MDDLLEETLSLQPFWVAGNTSQMQRRGVLIRKEIREWLGSHAADLAGALEIPIEDLGLEGRDGTGQKTEIPWVRVCSSERSPRATTGWYIVYLFSAHGDRVYLSLIQGTTVYTGMEFIPRPFPELEARVDWARKLLGPRLDERPDLVRDMALDARRSDLGPAYEAGSVIAIEYQKGRIPGREVLTRDVLFMARLLGILYRGHEAAAYVPGDMPPEVLEAETAAAETARRRSRGSSGQGFGLSAAERRAVELHSIRLATEYFSDAGWKVKDVGATESYDLLLRRGDERLHVEAKGTTSRGSQVVLTRAEVERQRALAPHNALVIVHSIELERDAETPRASGGILHLTSPWDIDEDDLTVVSYVYRTGL